MKLIAIIFPLLFLQVNTSFFDVFKGAVLSVENSFGKLLTDVVVDVKQTIDCTIIAVEHVLSLNGIFRSTPDYDERCNGQKKQKVTPTDVKDNVTLQDIKPNCTTNTHPQKEEYTTKQLSEQINASISNVNKTLVGMLDERDDHQLDLVQTMIRNETDRLKDVTALLKRELENISKDVTKQLEDSHSKNNASAIEKVLNDINMLHEIEKNDKNTTQATEIRNILDKVVRLCNKNKNASNIKPKNNDMNYIFNHLKNDSNTTFEGMQNQISKFKKDKNNLINGNKTIIESTAVEIETHTKSPKTFKDIAVKIIKNSNAAIVTPDKIGNIMKTTVTISSTTQQSMTYDDSFREFDYFFGPKDEQSKSNALKEAMDVIEKSRNAQPIIKNILKIEDKGVDAFEAPSLLTFR